jgi:hypothetical protein
VVFSCGTPVKKSFNNINDFETDSNDYDLHVVTKDSTTYFFKSDRYEFDNNTIDGFAIIINDTSYFNGASSEIPEPDRVILNFNDVDKVIKWGRNKKNFPSFQDETFIMITIGFIGLILLWLHIKNSIDENQKV